MSSTEAIFFYIETKLYFYFIYFQSDFIAVIQVLKLWFAQITKFIFKSLNFYVGVL